MVQTSGQVGKILAQNEKGVNFRLTVGAFQFGGGSDVERLRLRRERLDRAFDRLTARFDRLTARFGRLTARFDRLTARFGRLTARFGRLTARGLSLSKAAATTSKPNRSRLRSGTEMRPPRNTNPLRAVRPDRAFHLVARSVHGRAALVARTLSGQQPRRRPKAIRLRGASPSGATPQN